MNRFIWFYKAIIKKPSTRSSIAFQFHPGFFSFWQISKWESYVVKVREGGPSLRWKSSKLHLCNSTFLGKRTFSNINWHFKLTLKSKKVLRINVNFGWVWHLFTISSRPRCSFGHFNSNRYQSLHKRNVPTIVVWFKRRNWWPTLVLSRAWKCNWKGGITRLHASGRQSIQSTHLTSNGQRTSVCLSLI